MSSYDLLARHARNVLLMQTKFCENATLAAVLSDYIPCQFFLRHVWPGLMLMLKKINQFS